MIFGVLIVENAYIYVIVESMKIQRVNQIQEVLKRKSILLLGPRRTGKSYFSKRQLSPDRYYNLLRGETFRKLSSRPSTIREELTPDDKLVVIDEIQKIPELMDEVHALIEDFPEVRFLLTGSSARKLKREHTSLMAGRAKQITFTPFSSVEIPNFDLNKIIETGTLPPVYFSEDPYDELLDYVGLYLKEEIRDEALVRNFSNFSHFLDVAARSNGQIINFSAIASDSQVPPRTVKEYFNLLEDTLMGNMLRPIEQMGKRKVISKAKFYFFDIGVVNALLEREKVSNKSPEFGDLFEHFIYLELRNYILAKSPRSKMNYWNINKRAEVDFVINKKIAIEVKATELVTEKHFKGLKLMAEDYELERKIVVSRDSTPRKVNDIEIIPYRDFCELLWAGKLFK